MGVVGLFCLVFLVLPSVSRELVFLLEFSILSFYRRADLDLSRMGKRGRECQGTTEKGIIILSWRSDRGGGKMRRASDHPPLWMSSGTVERAHRQPQRRPVRPPCLVLLSGQGGRRSSSILTTLSRVTRVKRGGTRALNGPTPPGQSMAWSDTGAWAAENVRMSGCQAARAH